MTGVGTGMAVDGCGCGNDVPRARPLSKNGRMWGKVSYRRGMLALFLTPHITYQYRGVYTRAQARQREVAAVEPQDAAAEGRSHQRRARRVDYAEGGGRARLTWKAGEIPAYGDICITSSRVCKWNPEHAK